MIILTALIVEFLVLNRLMSIPSLCDSVDTPLKPPLLQQMQGIRTLHIIHCLSGNDAQFIDEWEWGLKSIIANAPLDANLHIHIIADSDAAEATDKKIVGSGLVKAQQAWRNEITITLNNVEGMLPEWRLFLKHALTAKNDTADESSRSELDGRVGIGGYFRLFAHEVIMPYSSSEQCSLDGGDRSGKSCDNRDLEEAVYMDDLMTATQQTILARVERVGLPRPLWIWNGNSASFLLLRR